MRRNTPVADEAGKNGFRRHRPVLKAAGTSKAPTGMAAKRNLNAGGGGPRRAERGVELSRCKSSAPLDSGRRQRGVQAPAGGWKRAGARPRLRVIEGGNGRFPAGREGLTSGRYQEHARRQKGLGNRSSAVVRKAVSVDPRTARRRRLVSFCALVMCLTLIALVLHGPISRMLQSRRELGQVEAKLSQEREYTRSLEERKDRALSEEYVEMEARRMGYVKPGEIPLVVLEEAGGEVSAEETSAVSQSP